MCHAQYFPDLQPQYSFTLNSHATHDFKVQCFIIPLLTNGWFSLATEAEAEAEEKGKVSFFFCLCRAVSTSAQGSLLLLLLLPLLVKTSLNGWAAKTENETVNPFI